MSLILVAEDETAVLEVLCDVVESLGHEPLRAHDGHEALELARARTPALILSDYMMPRLSGTELCRALQEDPELRRVPVILMSAARPHVTCEVAAFINKPFDLEQIERVINDALRRSAAEPRPRLLVSEGANDVARSELLRWLSHEVKTPLSAAKTHLQLLGRQASLDEGRGRERLAIAVRQLDKMQRLVESLLDAARLNDGRLMLRPEPTDLTDFLREVLGEWEQLESGHPFVLRAPDERVLASFDRLRVRQIVDNLLSNAVKYSAAATPVEVEVAATPDGVRICVRDHGPGIADEEIAHLFEPFRPADAPGGRAHGLGLYIAAEIARLHNGSLAVESTPGSGSAFTLTLPAAVQGSAEAPHERRSRETPARGVAPEAGSK